MLTLEGTVAAMVEGATAIPMEPQTAMAMAVVLTEVAASVVVQGATKCPIWELV